MQVKGNAFGVCSTLSRLGAISSPWVNELASVKEFLPGCFYATYGLIAGLLMMNLPRTLGRNALMSFDEALKFYKNRG